MNNVINLHSERIKRGLFKTPHKTRKSTMSIIEDIFLGLILGIVFCIPLLGSFVFEILTPESGTYNFLKDKGLHKEAYYFVDTVTFLSLFVSLTIIYLMY